MSKYILLSYGPFILELGNGGYIRDNEFNVTGVGVIASILSDVDGKSCFNFFKLNLT